jgi:hypothetical protein
LIFGNARRDPKENLRLAHRLLGETRDKRWSYDNMLIAMNLVIVATGGGISRSKGGADSSGSRPNSQAVCRPCAPYLSASTTAPVRTRPPPSQ